LLSLASLLLLAEYCCWHTCSGCHHCCCWRPFCCWRTIVAGVPALAVIIAVAGIPTVAGVLLLQASPDVYVVFAAAFEHVVAKLNSAVVCVLAVDSFPSVLG